EYSQLLGQSWAYQTGLGRILNSDKVTTHLESLWKYNFTSDVGPFREQYNNGRWYAMPGEGGIIACTWPYGGDEALEKGHRHFAGYLNECQPGYEWAATSLYMFHGMPYHALAHTRTMHERYHASKRNPWNEVEWGSHYSRSMASYGVFTAVCGFEYHGSKGYIAFSPRITPEDFKAAFTGAEGWGTFTQKRSDGKQAQTLELKHGKLRVHLLAFDVPAGAKASDVEITLADRNIEATFEQRENRVVITLGEAVTIDKDETLNVSLSY
ncbi:MAG: glycoside hydrolase family 116 protein, partial [Rhodospirillales bacterium]|nr:glycoside hydrolase family 116 protein [Rhodospirillales bacterium]